MFKTFLVILIFAFGCPAMVHAAPAYPLRFAGEVKAGQTFEQELEGSLVFKLVPNEWGWTITVVDKAHPDHDYTSVTLPEAFSNPRYIQTAFYIDAMEPLIDEPRFFDFVVNEADYALAQQAAATLRSSAGRPEHELEEARQNFGNRIAKGHGTLIIREATLGTTATGEEKITWLAFEVEIKKPDFAEDQPIVLRGKDNLWVVGDTIQPVPLR